MQRVIRCWSGPSGLVVVVEVLASSRGWYEVRHRSWRGPWWTVLSVGSQACALRVARACAREMDGRANVF